MTERQLQYIYTHFIRGLGPKTVISHVESGKNIRDLIPQSTITKENIDKVAEYAQHAIRYEYDLVTWEDDTYLEPLRTISSPPLWYFKKGTCSFTKPVAIVGTRTMTTYGKSIAQDITRHVSNASCTIVSGFMRGIDTVAHLESIASNNPTVAVLGSGFLHPVPPENRSLIARIVDAGGMVMSEFVPDQKATKYTFPQRNRIVAALSEAVIVVEAGAKSGALITARLAAEQGKRVLVVPGSLYSTKSAGCHWLIQNGAEVVTSVEGVLDQLGFSSAVKKVDLEFNSDDEKTVYEAICSGPIYMNDLIHNCRMQVNNLLPILTALELRGLIKNIGNDTYVVQ